MRPRSLLFRALIPLSVFVLSVEFASAVTSGLVPCGNDVVNGSTTDMCTYADLITLVTNVINFLIFKIAAPLAAIMFVYAGFLYITNGGNESKIKQAHGYFLAVFWGLVVALAAWLIINFVLQFLVKGTFNFLGP